jgi:hypothetical protein
MSEEVVMANFRSLPLRLLDQRDVHYESHQSGYSVVELDSY